MSDSWRSPNQQGYPAYELRVYESLAASANQGCNSHVHARDSFSKPRVLFHMREICHIPRVRAQNFIIIFHPLFTTIKKKNFTKHSQITFFLSNKKFLSFVHFKFVRIENLIFIL